MGAGESAARRARELRDKERRLREQADRLAAVAARHEVGSEGERLVASWSEPLTRLGYFRMDDLGIPGRQVNVDHVLVGPAGVFVVDAKNWSGRLETRGARLMQNGRDRSSVLHDVREQAAAVEDAAAPLFGRQVPIWPVVAFVGEASIGVPRYLDRVLVIDGPHLDAQVRSIAPRLTDEEVAHLRRVIATGMFPRTSSAEHAGDLGFSVAPNEDIVFLVPWWNYGKRRIYVKDEFGAEGGFLDLVSGSAERTTPASNAILAHLLPHYLSSDDEGLSGSDGDAIDRFVSWQGEQPSTPSAPPLVVGYHWRRRDARRLILHYLHSNGNKVDLGWVEIGGVQRVHAEEAGWEPVIRYCGRRYEEIEAHRRATDT